MIDWIYLDSDDDESYPSHLNETEESEPDQLDQN